MTMPETVTTHDAVRLLRLACTLGVTPSREALEELINRVRVEPQHEATDDEATVVMPGLDARTQPSRH